MPKIDKALNWIDKNSKKLEQIFGGPQGLPGKAVFAIQKAVNLPVTGISSIETSRVNALAPLTGFYFDAVI